MFLNADQFMQVAENLDKKKQLDVSKTPIGALTLVVQIILSLWFLNLLPNQACAAELAAKAWFGKRFKNS